MTDKGLKKELLTELQIKKNQKLYSKYVWNKYYTTHVISSNTYADMAQ